MGRIKIANIKGPKGDPGPQGIPGPKGDKGDPGEGGGSGIDPTDLGYDVVLLAGQSNMVGSGGARDAAIDVVDPRIWSFGATGANAGKIVQAVDPLAHHDGGSGVGPGLEFAKWYAAITPSNRRILLVPAAHGGTAILSGSPRWAPAWAEDTAINLYWAAIAQTRAALLAAGENARLVAILWVQGESDDGQTMAAYRTALESVIDGFRDRLSAPNLPFVMGSMVPEWVAGGTSHQVIQSAHTSIPTRKPFTAFVQGPTGYNADGIHYSPAGQRVLGRSLVKGYLAALDNANPANKVPANPPAPYVAPVTPPPVVTPPPSTPTVYAADTFTRADTSSGIGTTEIGSFSWTQKLVNGQPTSFGITSNAARRDGSAQVETVAFIDDGHADGVIESTINGQDMGVLFRAQDERNYWMLYANPGGPYKMCGTSNGNYTLGTLDTPTAIGTNDLIRVVMDGTLVKIYINSALVHTFTDTFYSTATKHGFWIGAPSALSSNARVLDWKHSAL